VKVVAYIDESGGHSKTGEQPGATHIVVAGWVDWWDNWTVFCRKWGDILDKYKADYFHFYEWVEASKVAKGRKPSSSFSQNPYKGWNNQKLDDLLFELAAIAGSGEKVFVGGFVSTKDFTEAKKHPDYSKSAPSHGDPYRACLHQFFEGFSTEVQEQWRYWSEPVTFFFDQNDDLEWGHCVQDEYAAAKNKDSRIGELTFADKKKHPHWPLQAADMLAYRFNQIARKFTDPEIEPRMSKLDDLLIKPIFTKATQTYLLGCLGGLIPLLSLRYGGFPWRNKS